MATPAQINANRLNALKSTGPRTPEGKAAARFNALKHGMDARSTVIPGEDVAEREALSAEYYAQFDPQTPIERFLVDTLVNSDWQRRRLTAIQAAVFNALTADAESPADSLGDAWQKDAEGSQSLERIYRHLAALERAWFRALNELRRIQRDRIESELNADLAPAALASELPPEPPRRTGAIGFVPACSEIRARAPQIPAHAQSRPDTGHSAFHPRNGRLLVASTERFAG